MSTPLLPTGSNVVFKRSLFGTYSFIENLLRIFLELLPHPLRYWIFKALLAQLGSDSMIDYQTYFRYPWKISIGNGVWINRGCEFYGSMLGGNAQITIGDHCALGPRVRVLSATHNYHRLDLPDEAASVTIGHHVWVGAGATILPGVTIGDGAVVAAGSVVTRDVAPFSIVAGNPARFLKSRELDDECAI
ncbi:acyltransferase [Rhodoferax ferrireducens]|uniref:acyltransferase n=1 Tax=Rhodoferax ferrireducens TaxID=192843 RepID=UPI001E2F4B7C|nr:DapH/DapD/GlmU-related protein [Rhodoferax ferrireducens]